MSLYALSPSAHLFFLNKSAWASLVCYRSTFNKSSYLGLLVGSSILEGFGLRLLWLGCSSSPPSTLLIQDSIHGRCTAVLKSSCLLYVALSSQSTADEVASSLEFYTAQVNELQAFIIRRSTNLKPIVRQSGSVLINLKKCEISRENSKRTESTYKTKAIVPKLHDIPNYTICIIGDIGWEAVAPNLELLTHSIEEDNQEVEIGRIPDVQLFAKTIVDLFLLWITKAGKRLEIREA